MEIRELEGITCGLTQCATFKPGLDAAEVLEFMQRHDGEIVHEQSREKHPDPLAFLRTHPEELRFWSIGLRHPALQPDVYDHVRSAERGIDVHSRPGAGTFGFIPESRAVKIRQVISFPDNDPVKVERVGVGLLQFIYHFAPLLRPAYGYIDIIPEDAHPGAAFNRTGTVGFLCWANYFGPQLVAAAGEEFLLDAPGWRTVKLPCGGILYVVTQNFLDWHFGKHRPYVQYFRKAFPNLEEL